MVSWDTQKPQKKINLVLDVVWNISKSGQDIRTLARETSLGHISALCAYLHVSYSTTLLGQPQR